MQLTDTHSHIYADVFQEDESGMMMRASDAGVKTIYMPAIDSETHAAMIAMEEKFPGVARAMMGSHPCSVNDTVEKELAICRQYLEQRRFSGIGETGLDFHWDLTFTTQQYHAFEMQARWALEFDLPLIIHSRNATDECIEVVQRLQNGNLRGIFHCFSGTHLQAKQIVDAGFALGIGGVLTFKNSGLQEAITGIDLAHIVLETDAPYLAPTPFRGKRNEPAYLELVAMKLAELTNKPVAEIAEVTSRNAARLFAQ